LLSVLRRCPTGAVIFLVACLWFSLDPGSGSFSPKVVGWTPPVQSGLHREPFFADESAYLSHTLYHRLFFTGRFDHPDWLHFAAWDSPPVFKYLIGSSIRAFGFATPTTIAEAEQWYLGDYRPPANRNLLAAARLPMMLGAALGVLAIHLVGRELVSPLAGMLAAVLLANSPLWFTHARRGMADDLTQGLILLTLWGVIRASRMKSTSGRWLWTILSGAFAGLAFGCKLNGMLAILAPLGWLAVAALGPALFGPATGRTADAERFTWRRALLIAGPFAIIAAGVFVGLNPFLWAQPTLPAEPRGTGPIMLEGHRRSPEGLRELRRMAAKNPWERFHAMLDYRRETTKRSAEQFPDDALRTIPARFNGIIVEGLGHQTVFGGPIRRRDEIVGSTNGSVKPEEVRHQPDPRSLRWIAPTLLVLWGVLFALVEGLGQLRRGEPPILWLPLTLAAIEFGLLLDSLHLNWDRYYLGPVTWSTLLMVLGPAGFGVWLRRSLFLSPSTEN
jgi:hypothetical protein